ncbi:MAG TPA: CrcB family protein [Acidimicrobiia bacterium]|jgi:CrcB protein|nr:CrcB family protein [Acidimicrobiia bacterium]
MRDRAREVAVIAIGGALGASARYGVARAEPVKAGTFPLSTFGINVVGALVLAVLLETLARRGVPPWWIRPFGAIGVLGGFTTFSTMCVEAMLLGRDGHVPLAILYALVSIATGVIVVVAGLRLAGLGPRVVPPEEGES